MCTNCDTKLNCLHSAGASEERYNVTTRNVTGNGMCNQGISFFHNFTVCKKSSTTQYSTTKSSTTKSSTRNLAQRNLAQHNTTVCPVGASALSHVCSPHSPHSLSNARQESGLESGISWSVGRVLTHKVMNSAELSNPQVLLTACSQFTVHSPVHKGCRV